MAQTRIEWAERVWNPVTGCAPISEGCQNCYAKRMSKRLAGRCGYDKDNTFKVALHPDRLIEPLKWRKPSRIFVCSMGDLFYEDVPFSFIEEVFSIMNEAERHTFMILTKRPERMLQFINWYIDRCSDESVGLIYYMPSNIWLGVTAENQQRADKRIPLLLQIPAVIKFVSVEPMLGPIDLSKWLFCDVCDNTGKYLNFAFDEIEDCPVCYGNKPLLDWVICGGETGPNRRPADINWMRKLRDQCFGANVPFFLKQMEVDGKIVKMPELDGRTWDEMPE